MGDVIWRKYASKSSESTGKREQQLQAKTLKFKMAISPKVLIRSGRNLTVKLRPSTTFHGWSVITGEQIQHG